MRDDRQAPACSLPRRASRRPSLPRLKRRRPARRPPLPPCSYFNYRVSRFLTQKGFYETWDFFDDFTWYPLGRVVGGTMYPGAQRGVWQPLPCLPCLCPGAALPALLGMRRGSWGGGGLDRVMHACRCTARAAGSGWEQKAGGRGAQCRWQCCGPPFSSRLCPPPPAGLIFTAGAIWNVLQYLHIPIHIQEVGLLFN